MGFYISVQEEFLDGPTVWYMRRTGPYGPENAALMEDFKGWIKVQGLYSDDAVITAIALDDPRTTRPQDCRYDVCLLRVGSAAPLSGKVDIRRLDSGRYLTFLIEHTPEAIRRAWAECFTEPERHGFLPDPARPVMERYAKRLVDRHLCELCVPIL
ncbi:MAG: GyrI-like domain-containing protein [Dysosmobacter sp.]